MNYRYEDLVHDLRIGREIAFTYRDRQYAITRIGESEWCFSESRKDYSTYDAIDQLLEEAKIDGVLIRDLVETSKIQVTTIY